MIEKPAECPNHNQFWKSPNSVILRANKEEEDGIVVVTFESRRGKFAFVVFMLGAAFHTFLFDNWS
jgi:hypothetical protein